MAIFEIGFPDDFMSGLLDTEFSEIAEEALKEAAPILEKQMKASCKTVIGHGGDSELVDSIRANAPKPTKTDAWIVNVGPRGYSKSKHYYGAGHKGKKSARRYPVSNALKAIWKEYGVPGRQPPRPFIQSACNAARDRALKKMQEVYNRKVGAG